MEPSYRIQAFAELAGVTVRTLHHYDRVGLLRPARSSSGYRVYSPSHLERLEQIVALRYLGLPLAQIGEVIGKERRCLHEVLAGQRRLLEDRRRQIDRAIAAIQRAEEADEAGQPATALITRIIEEIGMQNPTEFMNRYYSQEAQAALEERRRQWTPADQEKVTREWQSLFADAREAVNTDPASPQAQVLVARWSELLSRFTGGDAEIARGLNQAWADREHWPAEVQQRSSQFVDPEVWAFMVKARAVKTKSAR